MSDRDTLMIREALLEGGGFDIAGSMHRVCRKLLELERSRWQQPTDPDVLAVREIGHNALRMSGQHNLACDWQEGRLDQEPGFLVALAAYRKHKGSSNG